MDKIKQIEMWQDEVEVLENKKKRVLEFVEQIKMAILPRDLERDEQERALTELRDINFYQAELTDSIQQLVYA